MLQLVLFYLYVLAAVREYRELPYTQHRQAMPKGGKEGGRGACTCDGQLREMHAWLPL